MPSVKTVERQIGNVEAFDVVVRHPDGRDVRSDRNGLPAYASKFDRAAKGTMNVADWKEKRFRWAYPGFDCECLDGDGQPVHGGLLLANLRATYEE